MVQISLQIPVGKWFGGVSSPWAPTGVKVLPCHLSVKAGLGRQSATANGVVRLQ